MSWKSARLGDVCEVGPSDSALPENAPFLPMAHVKVGVRYPTGYELRGTRGGIRARANDLLFARITPCLENGKVAQLPSDAVPTGGSTEFLVVRPGPEVDPGFIYYWSLSPDVRQRAEANMTGTTGRMRLSGKVLAEFPISYPLIAEQRRIVDALEDHLSRIDAGGNYLIAVERRLETLVSAILCDLVPDEQSYPDNWEHSTVTDVGTVELGRQRHPDWHVGTNMKPYLRVANVFEDRIDTSDVMEMHWPGETFERFKLHPGDILLNEGQTPDLLGRPALYRGDPPDVAFTNSLLRFKAGAGVLPKFALLVFRRHMRAGRFKQESRITTNIAHLSANRFKRVEFPVPPLAEQRAIVRQAEDAVDAVLRLRSQLEAAKARRANLFRALLSAAFSGRLTKASFGSSPTKELVDV